MSGNINNHISRWPIFLLFLILPAFLPTAAFSVPAAPILHELTQPDGLVFSASQWGDEFSSGWETRDGFTIIFNEKSGEWAYAEPDSNGELASSQSRVGRDLMPPRISKGLRPKKKGSAGPFGNFPPNPTGTLSLPVEKPYAPLLKALQTTDTRNIPVILINFSDTVTTTTAADFTDLLFGTGTWSFKEYYDEVSYGKFSVSAGPAGVTGWITASQTHDYYGKKSGWGPPDAWPGDLAFEAVQQADASVDFSTYDNDGDCYVDTVAIVHQGGAQEATGNTSDIWSHSWSLSETNGWGLSHYGPYTTDDRCAADPLRFAVVDRYIMMPEKLEEDISTIGVFAHEYGHALGLIDLYDSDYSSEGAGNWSVMASGSWGGVTRLGDRPAHPDPWSKSALGWITALKVTDTLYGQSIHDVETTGEVYQMLDSTSEGGTGEYFLVENRQQTGFDAALPGSGLLLWHIDDKISSNRYESYPGCTSCSLHYRVALVQADNLYHMEKKQNRGDGGDPFPGSTHNRTFNTFSSPGSTFYSGSASGVSVSNISGSGAAMTATLTAMDSAGSIQLSSATYSVRESEGTVTITATRTGGSGGAVGVSYETHDGTATAQSDYISGGGTLSWANGDMEDKTFTVAITDDALPEPDETFTVTLRSATGGASLGSLPSGTVTIVNDDGPTASITATAPTATEAGLTPGRFTVTRTGATTSALTVDFTVGGTATPSRDYHSIGTRVTIPAGSASAMITVTPINDMAVESKETVTVSLSPNIFGEYIVGKQNTATVTMLSDDIPTVSIAANTPTALEAGPATGQFTVKRTGATTSSLTVTFAVSGTATSGRDYHRIGTRVTIPAGSTSALITVTPINDTAVESNETVIVTLIANIFGRYKAGRRNTATVTIVSDDGPSE